jgi:phytoene dehydrogenase-like protein
MRRFAYGPGVCKVDWALSGPVPWRAEACREAATVHVGGTLAQVARSEAQVNAGQHPEQPFCLVSQPGVVDPSRAPAGKQTLWGYCHVPAGSDVDMADRIEGQIERFAPGFRDLIQARSVRTAKDMEHYNPGYVGGDITAGAATVRQTIGRPTLRPNPYRTPLDDVYLCSASTPPGAGVHGMCGLWAARTALRDQGLSAAPG